MATILVVDDRPINRQFLTSLLGYRGYQTLEAADGEEALALMRARKPDLVITDFLMPVMDGYELARQMRFDTTISHTPIIFYSATYNEQEARTLAKAAGVTHVLHKPAEPQDILNMVETALGHSAGPVQAPVETRPLMDPMLIIAGKMAEKMGELGGLNRRLAGLVDLGLRVTLERDPQRLLQLVCDEARQIVGARYAAVGLLAEDGKTLRHFLTSGIDPETIQQIGHLPTGKGVLGKLLTENRPLRLADISADPDSVGFPAGHPPMRSFLGAPIATPVIVYGRLYLTEKIGAEEFSEEDEDLVVALAAQVAVAYENARLYNELQHHAASLQLEITERQKAQVALQVSERKFRSLVEHSADAIAVNAPDGTVLYVSPGVEKITGIHAEVGQKVNPFERIHPDDLEVSLKMLDRILQTPLTPVVVQFRIQHPNGEWRWVEVVGTNLIGESGVDGIVVNFADITERKRAEERLNKSETLFRTSFESSPVGLCITSLDGRLLTVNQALSGMLGFTRAELQGKHFNDITHPEDLELGKTSVRRMLTEYPASIEFEKRYLKKSGEVVWAHITSALLKDTSGEPLHFVTHILDITERKQAEEALRKSQETFSVIFNKAPFAAALSGLPDGAYLEVNEEFERLLGYSRQEVIGRNSLDLGLYPDPEIRARTAAKFQEQGFIHNLDLQLRTRAGELRYLLVNTDLVEIAGQKHILTTAQDISERKQAEEAVRASEEQYRSLFEDSPISLWVEDFSEVKLRLDRLKAGGVEDLPAYLREHPEVVSECAHQIKVVDVNSAAVKLYHAGSKAELLGRLLDILPTIPVEQIERELTMLSGGQLNFEREGVDETLTGEKINVSLRWTVAPGYEDTLARVIVSTIDVTERKRAEEHVQLQIQRLRALRSIDLAISSSYNLDLTLDILLNQVITQLKVDAASVLLFKPYTRKLEYAAGRGFHSSAIRGASVRLGEGYAGIAVLERRTIHSSNLTETNRDLPPVFLLMLREEGFVDYYCVPLIVKGEVKGVLEIYHRDILDGDAEWLEFLDALAGQAAIAIEDATLFEDLQRSNQELFQAYDATIEGWSHALDLRDKETEGHTQRVTELTVELARRFGFPPEQLINIRWGALLHDIGKMGVPDNILLKPDKLTDEEWEVMRKHPTFALEMLSPIAYLKSSLDIPYCHHEKWDGTGYPRGLKGELIPLAARLFAVVDVWDALRSDRPYRKAWSMERTIEHIRSLSGTHFDPDAVQHFLEMVEGGRGS